MICRSLNLRRASLRVTKHKLGATPEYVTTLRRLRCSYLGIIFEM